MYEAFFQLNARPFLAAPRVDRYFPAAAIEIARQNLTRSIERAEGPGLLVGPAGTGKSLLCRVLAEQFHDEYQVVHFSSARLCTRRALLQAMLYELDLPYRDLEEGELRLSLIDHLTYADTAKPHLLFIVDEAHALPLRLLEEIRMITNLLRAGQPCVRLILAGAPALEERFASPKLESFNQRIAARYYLEAFDSHDCYQYVCAQIAACGGEAHTIFGDSAFEAIYRATDGVPRLVNQIGDHALLLAHAGGVEQIEAAGVEEAWADLQQLPIPWRSGAQPQGAPEASIEFGALDDEPDASHAIATEELIDDEIATATATEEALPSAADEADEAGEADGDFDVTPFPMRIAQVDALRSLEKIESRLAEMDDDFTPIGTIGPETELHFQTSCNPFDEAFEEEEIVIDRYAMLDDELLAGRPRVENRGDDTLPELLRQHLATQRPSLQVCGALDLEIEVQNAGRTMPEEDLEPNGFDPVLPEESQVLQPQGAGAQGFRAESPLTTAEGTSWDDRDLIVIEEEAAYVRPAPRVRRQEYRQLFARLRRA